MAQKERRSWHARATCSEETDAAGDALAVVRRLGPPLPESIFRRERLVINGSN